MYWYPNRPLLQTRDFLGRMDRGEIPGDWWAEPKWNGDRLVLVLDMGTWLFYGRYGASPLAYKAPGGVIEELEVLGLGDGLQLDGELIHKHTKAVKNRIILWDVYVMGGERVREDAGTRRQWMDRLPMDGFKHVQRAQVITSDFERNYDELTKRDEIEGLVFKRSDGMIEWNAVKSPDVAWQIKVRKEKKNYRF